MTENPLRPGLRLERNADPCTAVIFGASGDLTARMLIPSLFRLYQQNLLARGFAILGTARTDKTDDEFRDEMREAVAKYSSSEADDQVWERFARQLHYQAADTGNSEAFRHIEEKLEAIEKDRETGGNRLFYLSTPPSVYEGIVSGLNESELAARGSSAWRRIIVEKPFGRDLRSAQSLNEKLRSAFREEDIYRIDHYLGKETVQNIMVLRFANSIFEPLWDRRYIDHVQITGAEKIGVEDRGGYFEQAGVLRDMIQNHLFQIFSLIAMEPPISFDAGSVRDEKTKLIRSVRPLPPEEIDSVAVRGQYGAGVSDGEKVPGYREERQVAGDSTVETYAALKLYVDNWRWAGVPFYLRSGKRLPKRVTEVAIQFQRPPHSVFKQVLGGPVDSNALVIRIQPDDGISLKFSAKIPGQTFHLRPVHMDFHYGTSFGRRSPDAYERLLLDAMIGESTLFARGDMVEASWQVVMPLLEHWKNQQEIDFYEPGTWGPACADEFIEADGRRWRRP
ncbi:MAG TPA: glucose-6-phosphate dehydrogenase [Acidobacteriota bacterium]|nr:glucose-6-phosphate dehydrogenase [Acidobacteriota bacterium]